MNLNTMAASVLATLFALLAPAQDFRPPKQAFQRADGLLDLNRLWSQGKAQGKGTVSFTHSPMRPQDIERIVPYGLMVGGHVMPIDHQYYYPRGKQACDVYSPADGFIVMIGHRVQLFGSTEQQRNYDDYSMNIEHSGTFYTFYDLLTELDPAILKQLDDTVKRRFAAKQPGPPVHVRIPVKAGAVVGKVQGRSLDIAVINTETRLKGFLTPALYGHYAWRLHVVDPFAYFTEPLKTELFKLNPRTAEPRGGKIDYDIDGRLVGNWFKEGTNGYAGNRDPRGYWMGHLAFVYHHIATDKLIVSIGDFEGRPRQFGVKSNGPDPAKVSKESGPVKYELIFVTRPSSERPFEGADNKIEGVVLAQVLDGRKVKVETFPRKTAEEVAGFTPMALTFER